MLGLSVQVRKKIIKFLLLTSLFFLSTPLYSKDKFKVITTFTIIADMASNVAGEKADVYSITKPGSEIHGYSPTPRDILKAQDADLILWNGMNLELWYEQFLSNLESIPSVIITKGINPISIVEGSYSGKPNPHAWMSLSNALIYVDNIRDALSKYDPENIDIYFKNAEVYKKSIFDEISPIIEKIKSIPKKDRWLVTCEGAFSYLAKDYDMRELYLWPINADQIGTPQQIRKVIDNIKNYEIKVIFCESTVSSKPAIQISRETEAKFGGVLYVDSLSKKNGNVPTFISLLKVTTETILIGLLNE